MKSRSTLPQREPYYHLFKCLSLVWLAILPVGCEHKKTHHEAIRPVLSVIAAPHSGPLNGYSGIVEPRYRTNLGFRVLGRMVARDVNVGDEVKAGQRLAALDPEILEFAVRSQEATLSNVRAQLVNSESNLKRQTILLAKKITPQAEFDAAQQANEAAAAAVTQAQANLDKAQEQLGYANLFADIDGVVTSIEAETGQTVAAGQTVVSIASPNLREAVIDLGEEVVAALTPEAKFRISLQISPDIETIGKVREIAPQADASTRTRRVRIALEGTAEAFRLGATITAFPEVALPTRIRLPSTSILKDGDSTSVWVVDEANKKVNRVAVKIRIRDDASTKDETASDSTVEIEEGLDIGARVVTAGIHSLSDGQSIRINSGDL